MQSHPEIQLLQAHSRWIRLLIYFYCVPPGWRDKCPLFYWYFKKKKKLQCNLAPLYAIWETVNITIADISKTEQLTGRMKNNTGKMNMYCWFWSETQTVSWMVKIAMPFLSWQFAMAEWQGFACQTQLTSTQTLHPIVLCSCEQI